jgi:hypothetical protein
MDEKWPEQKIEPCRFCEEPVTWTRKGTGEVFRGVPDYWYTSTHECQEILEARREIGGQKRAIEQGVDG